MKTPLELTKVWGQQENHKLSMVQVKEGRDRGDRRANSVIEDACLDQVLQRLEVCGLHTAEARGATAWKPPSAIMVGYQMGVGEPGTRECTGHSCPCECSWEILVSILHLACRAQSVRRKVERLAEGSGGNGSTGGIHFAPKRFYRHSSPWSQETGITCAIFS